MYLTFLLIALLCHKVDAAPLYTIRDVDTYGSITLTANKIYNVDDNSGNRTSYTVDIESPLIQNPN